MSALEVSLSIDGRPVTVPDGTSILEAAKTAGLTSRPCAFSRP